MKNTTANQGRRNMREAILDTILELTSQPIVAIDSKSIITVYNSAMERITGIRQEDVIGKHIHSVINGCGLSEILESKSILNDTTANVNGLIFSADKFPVFLNDKVVGAIGMGQVRFEDEKRNKHSQKPISKYTFDSIVGKSNAIKNTIELAKQYSSNNATVLITGETGTGKELFAHSIHNHSKRRRNPFVAINCSAIPENLLESELFGHEDGAFTGAKKGGRMGYFEMAHGGTIFLDEIADIDELIQIKLLRVCQEREILRVGGNRIIPIDVRIIVATNTDLYERVREGKFRQDLFFRLDVLTLDIPPLRDRKEDIGDLCMHFINQMSRTLNLMVTGIDHDVMQILEDYEWPGNIRELQNVVQKMLAFTRTGSIDLNNVKNIVSQLEKRKIKNRKTKDDILDLSLLEVKRIMVERALEREGNDVKAASKRLGIDKSTLYRIINRQS